MATATAARRPASRPAAASARAAVAPRIGIALLAATAAAAVLSAGAAVHLARTDPARAAALAPYDARAALAS